MCVPLALQAEVALNGAIALAEGAQLLAHDAALLAMLHRAKLLQQARGAAASGDYALLRSLLAEYDAPAAGERDAAAATADGDFVGDDELRYYGALTRAVDAAQSIAAALYEVRSACMRNCA